MKLFQITVLDDMDEISYLKVSDKNEDEIKKEIERRLIKKHIKDKVNDYLLECFDYRFIGMEEVYYKEILEELLSEDIKCKVKKHYDDKGWTYYE